jgi:hypothetical protein
MDFLKKHADVAVILTAFAGCMLWMNSQFNGIDRRFSEIEMKFAQQFSSIEKDMAVIKTVLIMKEIMPDKLAKYEEGK